MQTARTMLKDFVFQNATQGNLKSVIEAIDQFCWTKQKMMNVGDEKGVILDKAVQQRNPKTILELGTFMGYSSMRMISQVPIGVNLVSIEADGESAEIARAIHQFAGVADRITIVNDYSDKAIPQLKEMFHIDSFDLIFIDHYKQFYLRDVKLLEDHGLIQSGTVLVADNVITPGAPQYLQYIRNNPNYHSTYHQSTLEYTKDVIDGIEISVRK